MLFELTRKPQDVFDRRGAERIDRLRVVAHHGHALARGLEPQQDLGLQHVGVLVLVDQDVVEVRADLAPPAPRPPSSRASRAAGRRSRAPGSRSFARRSSRNSASARASHSAHHGNERERLGERPLRVDAVRVDREAGVLARKALLGLRKPSSWRATSIRSAASPRSSTLKLSARPTLLAVLADQPVGDRMEGARPGQPHIACFTSADDALRAARHLQRRAAGEGEEQDPLRPRPSSTRCATRCASVLVLPVPAPGDDEQRPGSGARRFALPGVELFERRRRPMARTIGHYCMYCQ